jgi:chromosome segregation ATPase
MKRTIGLLLIVLYAPLASAVYRCVDETGKTIFGDTPPSACAGNAPIYELSKSGTVLRRIEPTPTAEQLRERQDEAKRRKDEQAAALDQKRKDMALLNSFSNARDFDVARDRNIEPVKARISGAEQRIKEIDKREKDLGEQMEFYKGGKAKSKRADTANPADDQTTAWYRGEIDRAHRDRTTLTESIARYKKEIEEINVKFDHDKKRWTTLKSGAGKLPAEPVSASAKAKGTY